jgi:hypothetical protein
MVNDRFLKARAQRGVNAGSGSNRRRNAGHRACNAKYFVSSRWSQPVATSDLGSQHDDASESHERPDIGPVITRELAAIKSALERNARELAVLTNDARIGA